MNKFTIAAALTATLTLPSFADGVHAHKMDDAIISGSNEAVHASFDILAAHAHRKGNVVTFHMTTAGDAGAKKSQQHTAHWAVPLFTPMCGQRRLIHQVLDLRRKLAFWR